MLACGEKAEDGMPQLIHRRGEVKITSRFPFSIVFLLLLFPEQLERKFNHNKLLVQNPGGLHYLCNNLFISKCTS